MLVQQAFMKFHLNITTMNLKKQGLQHEMHHRESVSWDYVSPSFPDVAKHLRTLKPVWTIRPHEYRLVINTWTGNLLLL